MKGKEQLFTKKKDIVACTLLLGVGAVVFIVTPPDQTAFGISKIPLAMIVVVLYLLQWFLYLNKVKKPNSENK